MTALALDLDLTDYWWRWRHWLLDADALPLRRTCKHGHDWVTFAITYRTNGVLKHRCGECNRIANRTVKAE